MGRKAFLFPSDVVKRLVEWGGCWLNRYSNANQASLC
jgi:hypothetical protein